MQVREVQQAVQPSTRFALVTATLPEPVWLDVQALFPDVRMAKCALAPAAQAAAHLQSSQ